MHCADCSRKKDNRGFNGCTSFIIFTLLMLQLQPNLYQATGKKKGSVDIKESTFLLEWGELLSLFLFLLLNEIRNLSVWNVAMNQRIYNETIKTWRVRAVGALSKPTVKCWVACRHPQRGPHTPSHTRGDDDLYVRHNRADICRHVKSESALTLFSVEILPLCWTTR